MAWCIMNKWQFNKRFDLYWNHFSRNQQNIKSRLLKGAQVGSSGEVDVLPLDKIKVYF